MMTLDEVRSIVPDSPRHRRHLEFVIAYMVVGYPFLEAAERATALERVLQYEL